MKVFNEKGLTLIEILAALTISSMFLLIAYSIFTSMIKVNSQSSSLIQAQNELVTISQQMENLMSNINSVEILDIPDGNGNFKKFNAVDIRQNDDTTPGVFTITTIKTPIEINNGNIFINSIKVNSTNYSLANTSFNLISDKKLQIYYEIIDLKSNQKFSFYKIYTLQSE